LTFTGFVFAGLEEANQGVRAGLDGVGEFLEIFGDVPEIVQEFVDILGVDVEGLIQVAVRSVVLARVRRSSATAWRMSARFSPMRDRYDR